MKVISTGSKYQIFKNDLKTFDKLPADFYSVHFHPMEGFSLLSSQKIVVSEKIYGEHQKKVDKILNAFKIFDRNLGVILSGEKGIGKSLCAKMLAEQACAAGYPLIIVDNYSPGIAKFLSEIEQEVVIMFDEFDKTFSNAGHKDDMDDPQSEMLSLFDGLSMGKKMFIITCNEIYKLNDFLVNRPGRFHYHLRFGYPNEAEIREYLEDKLDKSKYNEINKVIQFANKVNLNYDCLRAIAFEISVDNPFEEAVKDLNILNLQNENYTAKVFFENGEILTNKSCELNLFKDEISISFDIDGKYWRHDLSITFNSNFLNYDPYLKGNVVRGDCLEVEWIELDKDDPPMSDRFKSCKNSKIAYVLVQRKDAKNLHYLV